MTTFGVLVRKRGAIGIFEWLKVKAPSQDSAVQQAHELGFEVNGACTRLLVVGVWCDANRFPPLNG
jgi:hypothetical protein